MSDVKDVLDMPAEVDFSHSQPNPYVGKVRRRVTINIDGETVDYFKAESARTGIPYQTIINEVSQVFFRLSGWENLDYAEEI